ncbi:protein of unknown function [Candidatus Methylomirabilis oxygeniifera]|uniref:Uncharacterized protein n=1 Tax=Methylomirabilis oxygeniifera TaxID=671143 RepID=D5MMQ9_METO1|nr:protein of unknown function [Candidatus Methylomirabilis oxyfera]
MPPIAEQWLKSPHCNVKRALPAVTWSVLSHDDELLGRRIPEYRETEKRITETEAAGESKAQSIDWALVRAIRCQKTGWADTGTTFSVVRLHTNILLRTGKGYRVLG